MFLRSLAIFLLSIVSTFASAVTVTDLYNASIPVSAQNSQTQAQAFKTGLEQILVKISGNTNVLQNKAISAAIKSAGNYVKEFSYGDSSTDPAGNVLNISYQPKAVLSLLQQNQLAIWGENRPLLAVWIVDQTGSQTQLVGTPSTNLPWISALLSSAGQRGLPIVLPLLDATDTQAVNPTILQQNNTNILQTASNRYNADGIMVLQINETNPANISTQWNAVIGGKTIQFTLPGNNLTSIITQGINQLTDQLAQQFASTTNTASAQAIQLQITGLNNVTQYAELDRFLKDLAGISSVDLVSLSSNQAIFNLTLSAPIATIQQQLNLSHLLNPIAANTASNGANNNNAQTGNMLIYQYSPH